MTRGVGERRTTNGRASALGHPARPARECLKRFLGERERREERGARAQQVSEPRRAVDADALLLERRDVAVHGPQAHAERLGERLGERGAAHRVVAAAQPVEERDQTLGAGHGRRGSWRVAAAFGHANDPPRRGGRCGPSSDRARPIVRLSGVTVPLHTTGRTRRLIASVGACGRV